jgi:hypothetical protein
MIVLKWNWTSKACFVRNLRSSELIPSRKPYHSPCSGNRACSLDSRNVKGWITLFEPFDHEQMLKTNTYPIWMNIKVNESVLMTSMFWGKGSWFDGARLIPSQFRVKCTRCEECICDIHEDSRWSANYSHWLICKWVMKEFLYSGGRIRWPSPWMHDLSW